MSKRFLTDLTLEEGLFIEERASALGDVAGQGQWWVKNDVPNTPWFTNDAGTDFQLSTLTGTETLTNKTIDGDNNTLSNLDIGNEVDWANAADVTTGSGTYATGDYLLLHEAGAGLRKIDWTDLPGGSGMTDFILRADSGSDNTMVDGDTIDIAGGEGIATNIATISTISNVEVDLDFSKLSTGAMLSTDYFIMQDVGASPEERRIQASSVKLSVFEDDLEYSATATIRNYDASDDIVIFTPNRNVTITEVIAAVSGGIGQSVTFNITHATTLTGTSPDLWTADQTVTSSTPATVSGTTSDNTVLADDAVRVKLSAAAGTGRQIFTVTVFYTST